MPYLGADDAEPEMILVRDQNVPARDGISLATDIYLPPPSHLVLPVIPRRRD